MIVLGHRKKTQWNKRTVPSFNYLLSTCYVLDTKYKAEQRAIPNLLQLTATKEPSSIERNQMTAVISATNKSNSSGFGSLQPQTQPVWGVQE